MAKLLLYSFPSIPGIPLLKELEGYCAGQVAVRSDWVGVADAPAGPIPEFPKGYRAGKLWIDYTL
jgi:hypothetical protein